MNWAESPTPGDIHRRLTAYRSTGPLSCDFDRRTISSLRGGSVDAIYIGVDGIKALLWQEIQMEITS